MCREKPSVVKDRESERALQRIATRSVSSFSLNNLFSSCTHELWIQHLFLIFRGVVQLFNAVRTHQKTVDNSVKESGSSERKKAKLLSSVSKKDFIDVLRRTEGGSKGSVNNVKSTVSPLMALCRRSFFYHSTKYLEVHRLHCIHIFFFLSFLHVYSHFGVEQFTKFMVGFMSRFHDDNVWLKKSRVVM